tara:strand:- start:4646 stop:5218 length:573 start_codon:yes stop_codon:yes gene_type:complete
MIMCGVLNVALSGFYQWLHKPLPDRAIDNQHLLAQILASYQGSSGVYGAPRVFLDLREAGETCGKNRVARLMKEHKIKALRGYKAPQVIAGRPSILTPNKLQREFTVSHPDKAWVTDISYIRTWQGWLYLAVVVDLFSRRGVGWSMKPTLHRCLVVDALLMAVWRRRPKEQVLMNSDQGNHYGSNDWHRF